MSFPTRLLIGGELREGRGQARAIENPANGQVLAQVNDASLEDVEIAVAAARTAATAWARVPEQGRAAALRSLAALIEQSRERLIDTIVSELGKPLSQATDEFGGTLGFLTFTASLLETRNDEIRYTGNAREEIWTRRRPYGVVAGIVPWNFPAALVTRKLGPALAAGNGIVLKADEKTPLSALVIAEVVAESGLFPEGLVSVLTGAGATIGAALVSHPGTDLITMTGSTGAGKAILAASVDRMKPVHLELGGKAPFIVLPDADLELAVADAVASRHLNNGQVCIANERTYVHESVYGEFVDRYVAAVDSLVIGDPRDAATQIGPKVSGPELEKVFTMLDGAVGAGATLRAGGQRLGGAGFDGGHWISPAVLTDVTREMQISNDEVFGPVTPISAYTDWSDLVGYLNTSTYGLSAYVYTSDLSTAMSASAELEYGEVYINRVGPEEVNGFHVGFRQSGLGGDDGPHGLEGYFRKQTTYVRY